ncbi:alpha/beta fold hydrolase [Nocardia pseudobrasiliensis]|uniref:Pimeloyl-ACP methyl ester carboxylesterase n=1 Tax=Nocardia pseudobrasiliensis TaxID=45979 RepID=A0A370I8B7_9NOCA|nr:alpha/beta hydrolase [Nocardia pseudobrasiliensis]RDI66860.1 pimeloyl-ACP methyl ester carboxylesterase [Nocardia pseudobrasiliensis]
MDSMVSADGVDIQVFDEGSGPPVLIIGPGLDDGTRTRKLAALLARRFRVIRLRRRQYRLDLLERGPFDVADEVADVLAVAHRLGTPLLVYGHSSGGVIALEAIAAEQHSFTGAVIFEPAAVLDAPWSGPNGEMITAARAAIAAGRSGRAMALFVHAVIGLPRWQSLAVGLLTALTPRHRRLVPCQINDLAAMDHLGPRLDTYARITVPTVLLGGDRSPARLTERVDAVAGVLPHAQRISLPRSDHGADVRHPDRVRRVIEDLADRVLEP